MEDKEEVAKVEKRPGHKIVILVLSIMIACIVISVALYSVNLVIKAKIEAAYYYTIEDGTNVNISKKVQKVKKVDGLEISITSLTELGGYTTILGEVYNVGESEKGGTDYYLIYTLYDAAGNVMGIIDPVGVPNVKPGEKAEMNTGIIGYYANVYNIKVELKQM